MSDEGTGSEDYSQGRQSPPKAIRGAKQGRLRTHPFEIPSFQPTVDRAEGFLDTSGQDNLLASTTNSGIRTQFILVIETSEASRWMHRCHVCHPIVDRFDWSSNCDSGAASGTTGIGETWRCTRQVTEAAREQNLIFASACVYSFRRHQTGVRPEAEQTYFHADLSPAWTTHLKRDRCRFRVSVRQARTVRHRQGADSSKRKS